MDQLITMAGVDVQSVEAKKQSTAKLLNRLKHRSPFKLMERLGIADGEGVSMTYLPSNSVLLIRHTAENLDKVEQLIGKMKFPSSDGNTNWEKVITCRDKEAIKKRGEVKATQEKLESIIIPVLDIENKTAGEVLNILKELSITLDPKGKGIEIILDPSEKQLANITVKELKLKETSMLETIRKFCQHTGLRYVIEKRDVVGIYAFVDIETDYYKRTYDVPPDFIKKLFLAVGDDSITPEGKSPEDLFKKLGITFDEYSYAKLIDNDSKLEIYNTIPNIDMIVIVLEHMNRTY